MNLQVVVYPRVLGIHFGHILHYRYGWCVNSSPRKMLGIKLPRQLLLGENPKGRTSKHAGPTTAPETHLSPVLLVTFEDKNRKPFQTPLGSFGFHLYPHYLYHSQVDSVVRGPVGQLDHTTVTSWRFETFQGNSRREGYKGRHERPWHRWVLGGGRSWWSNMIKLWQIWLKQRRPFCILQWIPYNSYWRKWIPLILGESI